AVRSLLANPEDDAAISNRVDLVFWLDGLGRAHHAAEQPAALGAGFGGAVPDDLLALGQFLLDRFAMVGRNLLRVVGQTGVARRGGLDVGVVRGAARAAVVLDVAVGGDHLALALGLLLGLALLFSRQFLAAEQLVDDRVQQLLADHLLD